MAGISTIDGRATLETLWDEYEHTAVRLLTSKDADVKALSAGFEAWETQWWAASKKERGLSKAAALAAANLERIDNDLDAISDAVAPLARIEDKVSPVPKLVRLLYGSLPPSLFKRPQLGSQYEQMKNWPGVLQNVGSPAIQAHVAPLQDLLAEGDPALSTAREAEHAIQEFRLTGDRPALAQALNALRKAAHGKLGEIAEQKKYGSGFAESFFRRRQALAEPTLGEIENRLQAARDEVTRLENKHRELLQAAEAEEKARAEAAEKAEAAEIAENERIVAERQARIAELKAKQAGKQGP
jgi:hypothetical protein